MEKKVCLAISIFCLLCVSVVSLHAAEKRTLIWHFDEGEGDTTKEATGNSNEGKFNSKNIKWGKSIRANGLEFSGSNADNQWVEVQHSDDLDIRGAITMEAWIFPTEISPGRPTVIYKTSAYHLRIDIDSQLSTQIYGVSSPGLHNSDGKVELNEWTHVAATYDGEEIKFYINGEQDAKVIKATGQIQSIETNVLIGGRPSG